MAFHPISIAPKDGTPMEVPIMACMRYMPYKGIGLRFGLGRWQIKINNTWMNTAYEPIEWQSLTQPLKKKSNQ